MYLWWDSKYCLQKSGLNINFRFLKCIAHMSSFFVRKFLALLREQYFSSIHKNSCWYNDCAIEYQLLAYFWKLTTLIGSFELNINTRSNIFNSLQPLIITCSVCSKHNVAICRQLLNLQASFWKNFPNVSSFDIVWFNLTTPELFLSLDLNKFIRGLFRTLSNI